MRYPLVVVLPVLTGVLCVSDFFSSGAESTRPEKVPASTRFQTGSLAWETTRSPTVAVSESGVVYVIWSAKGRKKAPSDGSMPMIPDEWSFGVHKPEWSTVPGMNVYRKGSWSKAALLVEGPKDCAPLWSWCEREKLHLLVVNESAAKCNHLVFDPTSNRWKRLAELPFAPSQYEAWRQVGKEVHIACSEGRQIQYLRYDGERWAKPIKIERSENKTSGVTRVRLAIDLHGSAHVAWWTAHPEPGIHGYAVIRDGKVTYQPLEFDQAPIHQDNFDVGFDPDGRPMLAYKADIPKGHRDALKVHIRFYDGKGWTKPETVGGEGEILFGDILVVSHAGKTLVSWLSREDLGSGGAVILQAARRFSVHDGKSWTPSRWCASEPGFGRRSGTMGAIRPGVCIDKNGGVHMAWGNSHCVVTHLKK